MKDPTVFNDPDSGVITGAHYHEQRITAIRSRETTSDEWFIYFCDKCGGFVFMSNAVCLSRTIEHICECDHA